jgi:hypothetical protein
VFCLIELGYGFGDLTAPIFCVAFIAHIGVFDMVTLLVESGSRRERVLELVLDLLQT